MGGIEDGAAGIGADTSVASNAYSPTATAGSRAALKKIKIKVDLMVRKVEACDLQFYKLVGERRFQILDFQEINTGGEVGKIELDSVFGRQPIAEILPHGVEEGNLLNGLLRFNIQHVVSRIWEN